MRISRFEPWNLMHQLHRDLDHFTVPRFALADSGNAGNSVAEWVPAVDIFEQEDRFVLRADLPGVSPDDIDVNMDDGVLTLTGERRTEADGESAGMQRVERSSGKFYRRFSLPETADADGVTARSANGILEVVISKLPEVKARRITVEAA